MDSFLQHGIRLSSDSLIQTTHDPVPKEIILLVDNALPFVTFKEEMQSALANNIRKLLFRPVYSDTRAAVIIFDDKIRAISNFVHVGRDREEINQTIELVDFSSEKTNEASALFFALNTLAQSSRANTDNVIVLVSDGLLESGSPDQDKSMSSWITEKFLPVANSQAIKIFAVVPSETANYNLIQSLSEGTGGVMYPAYNSDLMSEAFKNIRSQLSARMLPSRWIITDGDIRHILRSHDNGVMVKSEAPLSEQSRFELSTVRNNQVEIGQLTELKKDLEAAGQEFNQKNLTVIRKDNADSAEQWQIRAPFEIDIVDKGDALSIKWNRSWVHLWDGRTDLEFFGLFVILLFYRILVEVNATSVHSFYRDRLSRAFIFGLDSKGDIQFNDDLKLHELNKEQTTAPYHLINVALNLHGCKDPELRGRKAEFFIFSKLFSGSVRTGYAETHNMEAFDSHLNLATAMAISGAAAAPNMGTTTVKQLVFLLTMLNIRLGYWLPNPRVINGNSKFQKWKLRFGVGARYLLRESLSRLDDEDAFVNVSDGGHLENLGMYELLRRRCKFIISVDGEADPAMGFNGLVKLILYARIDMGIVIDIELSSVRKNKDGFSQKNWAFGTIRYGKEEFGHLLYIKSSLSGDENEYIREYRSRNPSFPHESTIDQFFDETQFEAYRALGFQIGDKLFGARKEMPDIDDLLRA